MKILHSILIAVFAMTLNQPLKAAETAASPVSLSWELLGNDTGKKTYRCAFTVRNESDATLSDGWTIYFNNFPRKMEPEKKDFVTFSEIRPGYYKITPGKNFRLAPGEAAEIVYTVRGSLKSISYAPDGGHFAFVSDKTARPLPIEKKPIEWGRFEAIAAYPTADRMFAQNEAVNAPSEQSPFDILPGLKSVTIQEGTVDLSSAMTIYSAAGLDREAAYANRELSRRFDAGKSSGTVSVVLSLMSAADAKIPSAASNAEYYELTLSDGKAEIRGVSADAVLNGVKSLAKIMDGNLRNPIVPQAEICDWPDLRHRGMMLDIVRNYSSVDNVRRLIDKLASYKLNRLQFHITDDEAWRIEIPGLPELTEVGGRRGMTETETDYLCQFYAGNGNPDDLSTTSNGFLSRQDFIGLLRFAYDRGVEIVPEIESPGHARAAIMAMRARYNRLKASDPEAAELYRIWDPDDTSEYTSAQGYHDNVLNPAAEGTFRFMEKVVDELILMYREAGVPLPYIHVGGDEVPRNPWAKSPAVQKMMAEKGFSTTHEIEEYFICRIADIIDKKGYRIGGWQEAAMRHSEATDRFLRPKFAAVNCWSTVPDTKSDSIPYSIANNGYNALLCNVGNFYVDMAYTAHPDEPGLTWGGYVDEYRSWDARPFDIYKSTPTTIDGTPIDTSAVKPHQIPLKPEMRRNIIGVQAQLFAETIRDFKMVEYYTFPKIFGLVERGWNAFPLTGQTKARYNRLIGSAELPALLRDGVNFRVGMPGIKEKSGMLIMNKPYDEAEIRYTTDGSEPTSESQLWTKPVKAAGKVVKAKLFYLGKESVATRLDR